MKKFFALTLCLFASVLLFAQPQGKPNDEQRKKDWERLQAEKIAFITQELDLTPEEAQVFWPVYNQCWKEVLASHKATREAFAGIRGKDAYIQASTRSNQVLADWYPKFKQVLPIRKVSKLYQAEEAFQQRMINNLRKHPQHPSK